METVKKIFNKKSLLVIDKTTGGKLLYGSIERFVEAHPTYSRHTLWRKLGVLHEVFEDQNFIVERVKYYQHAS